jgi:hypothetical protein
MPKKVFLLFTWIVTTISALAVSLSVYRPFRPSPALAPLLAGTINPVYAALPQITPQITATVYAADARPVMIDKYLAGYGSPLAGYGQIITQVADAHQLDPYLFIAIAQQESNLCKKIPPDSYNCWGWGIHSQGTLRFDSYEQAITAVIAGLTQNYIGQGLIEPADIMRKYTPLSTGSWAAGVNQFLEELRSGEF